jgi:hypothetical protein
VIGDAIQRFGGGTRRIRRLTLFEQLDRSPESGLARQQITNSSRYAVTTGSYKAEFLELTELGMKATSADASARERLRARFELAINNIDVFRSLYDAFKDHKLPAQQVMRDHLIEAGAEPAEAQEAVELFIVNAKFIGLLRPVSGTERVLSIDHVLDELPAGPAGGASPRVGLRALAPTNGAAMARAHASDGGSANWDRTCFYITPIGAEDSEARKHADVFLGHIGEPAIEALDMDLESCAPT